MDPVDVLRGGRFAFAFRLAAAQAVQAVLADNPGAGDGGPTD